MGFFRTFFASIKRKFAKFFRTGKYKKSNGGRNKGSNRKMTDEDYADIKTLELNRNATFREIRQSYMKKALEHHPDRHVNATDDERELHEEQFKMINNAYSSLCQYPKKRKYRKKGKQSKSKQSKHEGAKKAATMDTL
jgi:DnaJ-class molecular chaperone